jgi:hypothetical protein
MTLFHHTISFPAVDPLGDGLAEEIEAEREEPEAMSLESDINGDDLSSYWQYVSENDDKESSKNQSIDE